MRPQKTNQQRICAVAVLLALTVVSGHCDQDKPYFPPRELPERLLVRNRYVADPFYSYATITLGFHYVDNAPKNSSEANQLSLQVSQVRRNALGGFAELVFGTGDYLSTVKEKSQTEVSSLDSLVNTDFYPFSVDVGATYGVTNNLYLFAGGGVTYKRAYSVYRDFSEYNNGTSNKVKKYTVWEDDSEFELDVKTGLGIRLAKFVLLVGFDPIPMGGTLYLGGCLPDF